MFQKLLKTLKSLGGCHRRSARGRRGARAGALHHGMQRMTARVLATLLFTEQPTMTAGDLGERLQASSGAISGAVKMLTSVGLVERVPRRPAAATTIGCATTHGRSSTPTRTR